jgi:aerobic carbon-monoxide dehydrogenase large subunit
LILAGTIIRQIGKSVLRVEDERFLTGRGRYVDDITLSGMCFGAVVYSPHAHALIAGIDVSRAVRVSGVIAVLTGQEVAKDNIGGLPPYALPASWGGPNAYTTRWAALAADRVRFVGDRVAFVVAETAAIAREAADLVDVSYEALPNVVDIEKAVRASAPRVWEECRDNVSFTLHFGDRDENEAVFAAASHVVELRLVNGRLSPSPLEPRAAIGDYKAAEESFTLYTSSQNPHGVRSMLATSVFGISETQLRVISPDVGGGFGVKANAYPEDILVLWASRRCRRPVKWVSTRAEAMMGDNHGRDQVAYGKIALNQNGRISAMRVDALHSLGAYFCSASASPLRTALRMAPNVYDIGSLYFTSRAVFTNTSPMGVYRGAGRPEAVFLIERLIDSAAKTLDLDPIEIRRRNLISTTAMPFKTITGCVYDSGDFEGVLNECLNQSDWKGFEQRRSAAAKRGMRYGRGIAMYVEYGGVMNETMQFRFDPSGGVTILAGTHSHGQGHATTYTQMAAEWLGIDPSKIRFVQGDTDKVSFGRGTYAARSSLVGGCALRLAADAVIAKAGVIAALLLEADVSDVRFEDGLFKSSRSNKTATLTEVAKACFRPHGLPAGFSLGLDCSGTFAADPPNYPNGVHICEAEVDPETGAVAIVRYSAVDDVGRVFNPMICEGQIHGGLAQGLGQALLEAVRYESPSGQLLTGSFTDYAMPRADNMPPFHVSFHELPATTNPLGIKGVGEAGAVPAPAAIINALIDALAPIGVTEVEMPATPACIWNAIEQAKLREQSLKH